MIFVITYVINLLIKNSYNSLFPILINFLNTIKLITYTYA